jgi:hypothetical protein
MSRKMRRPEEERREKEREVGGKIQGVMVFPRSHRAS